MPSAMLISVSRWEFPDLGGLQSKYELKGHWDNAALNEWLAQVHFFFPTHRHRRRHAHCAGRGVPVLKVTASPRVTFRVPARPCPRDGHAVGDADT